MTLWSLRWWIVSHLVLSHRTLNNCTINLVCVICFLLHLFEPMNRFLRIKSFCIIPSRRADFSVLVWLPVEIMSSVEMYLFQWEKSFQQGKGLKHLRDKRSSPLLFHPHHLCSLVAAVHTELWTSCCTSLGIFIIFLSAAELDSWIWSGNRRPPFKSTRTVPDVWPRTDKCTPNFSLLSHVYFPRCYERVLRPLAPKFTVHPSLLRAIAQLCNFLLSFSCSKSSPGYDNMAPPPPLCVDVLSKPLVLIQLPFCFFPSPRAQCLPQHGGPCSQQHSASSGLRQAADPAAVGALLPASQPLRPQCRTTPEECHPAAGRVSRQDRHRFGFFSLLGCSALGGGGPRVSGKYAALVW